jgi:hypothetical protein
MDLNTNVLSGNGNFTANAGSVVRTGNASGLTSTGGITGSVQVSGTRTYSGRVEYNGTVAQSTGNVISVIDSVVINNINGVSLSNSRSMNWVSLQNGTLMLGNNDLTINAGGTIVGGTGNNFIMTNGSGNLRRTVANNATNVLFPIGSNAYAPVQVQMTVGSTTDVISARVFNGVLSGGATGSNVSTSMVNRSWVLSEAVAGGSNATVTVQWQDTMESGGFNRNLCGVAYYQNTPASWVAPQTFGASTGTNPYTRSRSGMTVFSVFTVVDNAGAVSVPVEMVSLTATSVQEDVVVSWQTASERNSSHYEVERSTDGKRYEKVGEVESVHNSVSLTSYNYMDKGAGVQYTGMYYYRLRQVDMDGKHSYYGPVSVDMSKVTVMGRGEMKVMPNPFVSSFGMELIQDASSTGVIRVYDMQGREVMVKEVSLQQGMNKVSVEEMMDKESGVYFVELTSGNQVYRSKLIKSAQ